MHAVHNNQNITSLIKDKIREYMMQRDSPSDQHENIPNQVTNSIRRIGTSLDALVQESKRTPHAVPVIKKNTNTDNNTALIITADFMKPSKTSTTLHSVCEDYIEFITTRNSTLDHELLSSSDYSHDFITLNRADDVFPERLGNMHVTTSESDTAEKTLENGKNDEENVDYVVTNGIKLNEDIANTKDNNEDQSAEKMQVETTTTITTNGIYEEESSNKEPIVQDAEVGGTNGNDIGHINDKVEEEENMVTKVEEEQEVEATNNKIEKSDKIIDQVVEKKNDEEVKGEEEKHLEDNIATNEFESSKPIQIQIQDSTKEQQLLVKVEEKVQNDAKEEVKEDIVMKKEEISKPIIINEDKVTKNGTKRRADVDLEGDRDGNTSGSEGEECQESKRIRFDESIFEEDERDRLIREFVEKSTDTMEDINKNCDKLHQEISRLSELARCKELEWNTIIRILKLKEEMLERIMFKRRQSEFMKNGNEMETDKLYKQLTEQTKGGRNGTSTPPCSSTSTMVPAVSSATPLAISSTDYPIYKPSLDAFCKNMKTTQRPILPKPPSSTIIDQNSIVGEGRQGPILDVKSIIADFRSKNPENIPKRGRRPPAFVKTVGMEVSQHGQPRFLTNTALLSMANMALGSGSHVRTSVSSTSHDTPTSFLIGQESSITAASRSAADSLNRVISVDPMMMSSTSITASSHHSFQDALVKFAKRNERRDNQSPHAQSKQNLPPPPPYPEVTLHPVMVPQSSSSSAVHNSLLHGILTKANSQQCAAQGGSGNSNNNANNSNNGTSSSTIQHRPTTFSPTLARLLTAPERVRNSRIGGASSTTKANPKSAITEILNCKKARTEVTITPVASSSTCIKNNNDNIVLLQDDDDDGETDRLVIDEGRDTLSDNVNNIIPADQVPECQGCHKKVAQFVCAGCGNQWYCSRECQVQAWEDHSEMCSG